MRQPPSALRSGARYLRLHYSAFERRYFDFSPLRHYLRFHYAIFAAITPSIFFDFAAG
jgi:hypothetical protein